MKLTGYPVQTPAFRRKYEPWNNDASFSGCDIVPCVYGIDATTREPKLFVIGDISTLTYSIHRDKGVVRALGHVNPKGFTRGSRTIAGSIIFNVFNRRALWELSKHRNNLKRVVIADELPGFDIILYFANEYGNESTLILYNVQIVDEGQSHSVNDMYIENTMQYLAQDIELLEPRDGLMPSGGIFLNEKRRILNALTKDRYRIPFDYSYLEVNTEKENKE